MRLAKDEVNHVGEAIVMVVAVDRYVAEDAAALVEVSYDYLPAVVGVSTARAAESLVHEDVPGNQSAVQIQESGDAAAAIAAAPHRQKLSLSIERSASMPMEGKGVLAGWDEDDESLLVHTSTQTSTSVRQAIAAKLGLRVDRVEVVTPDVGGGFGVKIVHPWPEEILVPWAAIRLGKPVKWVEDRREHFISSAHERGQLHEVEVGYDDDGLLQWIVGGVLARQRGLHAVRADRADHHRHPVARSLQAWGLPGRVPQPLHQHGARDAVPRSRPTAGLFRDGTGDGCDRPRARARSR